MNIKLTQHIQYYWTDPFVSRYLEPNKNHYTLKR
jgi:hypothetical protein